MPQVTSDQVADYRDLVESLAQRLVKAPRAKQVGAEYDDLVQEGMIDVWKAIGRGVEPSRRNIENRMRDHIRWLGRQWGVPKPGDPQHVPYDEALPLVNE